MSFPAGSLRRQFHCLMEFPAGTAVVVFFCCCFLFFIYSICTSSSRFSPFLPQCSLGWVVLSAETLRVHLCTHVSLSMSTHTHTCTWTYSPSPPAPLPLLGAPWGLPVGCLLLVILGPSTWHTAVLMYFCTFDSVICETELTGIVPMNMHLL